MMVLAVEGMWATIKLKDGGLARDCHVAFNNAFGVWTLASIYPQTIYHGTPYNMYHTRIYPTPPSRFVSLGYRSPFRELYSCGWGGSGTD